MVLASHKDPIRKEDSNLQRKKRRTTGGRGLHLAILSGGGLSAGPAEGKRPGEGGVRKRGKKVKSLREKGEGQTLLREKVSYFPYCKFL